MGAPAAAKTPAQSGCARGGSGRSGPGHPVAVRGPSGARRRHRRAHCSPGHRIPSIVNPLVPSVSLAALLYRALASGPPPAPAPTSAALAHHRWRDGATLFLPLRLFRRPDPFTTCHRLTAAVAVATTIISNAVVDVNMESAHNIFDEMPVRVFRACQEHRPASSSVVAEATPEQEKDGKNTKAKGNTIARRLWFKPQ
uniref:Uncharacterized protein n=1 Tax=Saccharum officinarum TaxID=4547 RepID=A0A678T8S7_SACOF|nr:hypothetical protein SO13M23_000004 [Saccharum officinarum]